MPKAMEMDLKSRAKKLGLSGASANRYIYGTMHKAGWKPKEKMKSNMSLGDAAKQIMKRAK